MGNFTKLSYESYTQGVIGYGFVGITQANGIIGTQSPGFLGIITSYTSRPGLGIMN
jgi:hypothetical protein